MEMNMNVIIQGHASNYMDMYKLSNQVDIAVKSVVDDWKRAETNRDVDRVECKVVRG